MLTRDQQIRVNALLLEREALFLRIHEIERSIAAIFGDGYPLPRPPLPSDAPRGGKRKPKPRPAATTAESPARPASVRRLEESESAYRVTYQFFGRTITEDHRDPDALRSFLAAQGETTQIQRIETLDATGTPAATLFP